MTSELDPQARALIGLALRGEQRLPRDRARVRRGVLTALAAPAALGATDAALAAGKATGAVATGTKALLFGTVTWLKAAPLVALGVAAGVVALHKLPSTPPPPRIDAPLHASPGAARAKPLPVVVPVPAAAQVNPPIDELPVPSTSLKANRTGAASVEAPGTVPAPPSLAAELEALQRAQRSLNAGNAARALVELRTVSGHALRAERTALEVFANCALGNTALARQQAALFRQLAPGSPLLPRVAASCAAE